MGTLIKLVILLVLWQTGLLSAILIWLGAGLMWAGAVLQPSFVGVL